MQLFLTFCIGLQLAEQSFALYFSILNSNKKYSSTFDWILYSSAMAILVLRHVQILLGVKISNIGSGTLESAIIQIVLSFIFLYFAYRKYEKYQVVESSTNG